MLNFCFVNGHQPGSLAITLALRALGFYEEQSDTKKALNLMILYAYLSLAIARNQQNKMMIYNRLTILGVFEIIRLDYPLSLEYLNKALGIARDTFQDDEP